MDSVSMDDKFQKVINDSIEKNMKTFTDSKVNIFNVYRNTREIKSFLQSLVMSILEDLKSRETFLAVLIETMSITDIMSIKLMELEKRVKELEEKSV